MNKVRGDRERDRQIDRQTERERTPWDWVHVTDNYLAVVGVYVFAHQGTLANDKPHSKVASACE